MAANRMAALVACMFVACLTQGQLYAFSVYGGALKASLELTQDDLDTIATFPYISGLFVWVPGRLNDRWGPRAAIRFGATGMALGTVAYWAVARQLVAAPRVPALVVVMFLTQLVHGAVTAGIFSSLVRNFPLERGVAAGAPHTSLQLHAQRHTAHSPLGFSVPLTDAVLRVLSCPVVLRRHWQGLDWSFVRHPHAALRQLRRLSEQ